MYKFIILFSISFILFGCGDESSSGVKIPDDINYSILEDEKLYGIKRSVEVSLNKKVSREVLKEFALSIKESDSRSYQRTFIGYFIAGNDRNQGYWASSHFNPNLEVEIIGLSIEDEKALIKKAAPAPEANIIGSWLADRPYIGGKMTLFYTNGKLFLESAYSDGSLEVKEMAESRDNGGKRIYDKGDNIFGEYFIINESNELEFWSKNDHYFTAKKLP